MLCEYGCGNKAIYQFKNGRWCCSQSFNQCSEIRKKTDQKLKGKKKRLGIKIKESNILCSYGCNRSAKFYFKTSNKYCCTNHYKKCPSERNRCKIRFIGENNPMYNKHHNEKTKIKISNKLTGKNHPMYNQQHSIESKEKMRKNHSPNSGRKKGITNIEFFGKQKAKEIAEKASKNLKGRKLTKEQIQQCSVNTQGENNPMYGKKHKQSSKNIMKQKAYKRFKNPSFLKHWVKSITNKEMNIPEKFLNAILFKIFNNEYKFVGDYSLWINGKNPDFINKKRMKIIEYFGNWWHSEIRTGIPENIEDQKRKYHFQKFGYDTFIIREEHLKDLKTLIDNLKEFNNA